MSNFKTKNMDNRIIERLCRFYEMPKEVYIATGIIIALMVDVSRLFIYLTIA